jgi:hypothetical protein
MLAEDFTDFLFPNPEDHWAFVPLLFKC